ncbi:uncharacterized protein LOC121860459 [Homarus americanus]|nr:uncharacterized protein LOC121860459 [Homarus americanus]
MRGKTAHYRLTLESGETRNVVVKKLHNGTPLTEEATILQELDGAGGVPLLYGVTTKPYALVMDLCPGITFTEAVMRLNRDQIKYLHDEVLSAITQFHAAGYSHHDLHGDNVIINTSTSPMECHIVDVGEAVKFSGVAEFDQKMKNKDSAFLRWLNM